jgi:hypothetical protein
MPYVSPLHWVNLKQKVIDFILAILLIFHLPNATPNKNVFHVVTRVNDPILMLVVPMSSPFNLYRGYFLAVNMTCDRL